MRRAGLVAVAASALGFAMSRAYPWALARWDFITLDYFLAVAMAASHVGFLVAVAVLARPSLRGELEVPRGPALPFAALGLSILTYLWVP